MAQTDEQVKPDALAEYSDDTLAEMSDSLSREAEHLFRLARGAHEELRARLVERGATKLDSEHWEGTLKPGAINHTVDDVARFQGRLAPLLTPLMNAAAFVQLPAPPIRVDHRVVNELHKRGGEMATIIEDERKSVRGDPTLVLTRKVVTG